jgi:hypothetical protein
VWWLGIATAAALGGTPTWVVRRHMLRQMAYQHDQHNRDLTSARTEAELLRSHIRTLAARDQVVDVANAFVMDALGRIDRRGAGR